MAIEKQVEAAKPVSADIVALLQSRQGHALPVAETYRATLVDRQQYKRSSYECDGDCGTDGGSGVCFCSNDC